MLHTIGLHFNLEAVKIDYISNNLLYPRLVKYSYLRVISVVYCDSSILNNYSSVVLWHVQSTVR